MFELDMRSRKPIYEQLVDKLKELIINGVLQPDEQLPSVRALAQQLTINPNTIQKAYRELETQGFIYSQKGKGSFVSPSSFAHNEDKIEEIKAEIERLVLEAFYLGVSADELIAVIINVVGEKGGKQND